MAEPVCLSLPIQVITTGNLYLCILILGLEFGFSGTRKECQHEM